MESLRAHLNKLEPQAQAAFAANCGTTVGYLRKVISAGLRLGERLCIAIERETSGKIRCEDLRSDVDWAYIRGTEKTVIQSERKVA